MSESNISPEDIIKDGRGIIDDCDKRIIEYLVRRLSASKMIALAKAQTGDPIFVQGRDTEVRATRLQWAIDVGAEPDQLEFIEHDIDVFLGDSVNYQHDTLRIPRPDGSSPQT